MKVLFSNPPWFELNATGRWDRSGVRAGSRWPFTRPLSFAPGGFRFGAYLPFPFFLASAARWVANNPGQPDTIETVLRDSIARGETYEQFFRYVTAYAPDFVIIETGAAAWPHDRALVAQLKRLLPSVKVAIAGPTAAVAAAESPDAADAFFQGEYEKNSLRFVRDGIRGLLPFDMLTRQEMDAAFPMYDRECETHYWDACPKGQTSPHLQLLTSRGCVYKCSFCAWPATMTGDDPDGTRPRAVRFHSSQFVRMVIDEFRGRHPELRSVYFDDDTFNLSDRHVLGICDAMQETKLPWSAMCRADTSKPETWRAMKEAGCFGVKLGFESGSQRVIDQVVGKCLNLEEAAETARWLRKELKMTVHGTFTVGLPGETPEERKQTERFIVELYRTGALDTHQLSGTATIEGTPLDRIAKGEKLARFPGASAENFVRSADGNKKLEALK